MPINVIEFIGKQASKTNFCVGGYILISCNIFFLWAAAAAAAASFFFLVFFLFCAINVLNKNPFFENDPRDDSDCPRYKSHATWWQKQTKHSQVR